MYSKDELLSKDISELENIAVGLGLNISSKDVQEDIIYAILDKQAEVESNKNPLSVKRRRTRIVKKDTDHVYSVNGKEGENFDTPSFIYYFTFIQQPFFSLLFSYTYQALSVTFQSLHPGS